MLTHLSICNFAIVDELQLEFKAGFTALTGETGAGKSILIDALALTLGGRADASQVRIASERCDVVAEFQLHPSSDTGRWLESQAMEGDEGRLLLRRVVDRSGRSRAFINGHAATLAQLKEVSESLVDVHGQHAHQSLLRPNSQKMILDAHAGLLKLARETAVAYREWDRLARVRSEFELTAAARAVERGNLAAQVEELVSLNLAPGEWDAIQSEHGRLAHAASLIEGVQAAIDCLSDSEQAAQARLAQVLSVLRPLVTYDTALAEGLALLQSAEAQIQEAAYALRHYADRLEIDPGRLTEVERRLNTIHGAGRRFRTRPEELGELLTHLQNRLRQLDVACDVDTLSHDEQVAHLRYRGVANRLSVERKKAATKLSREVTATMRELAMAGGRFQVELRPVPEGGAGGDENIEFLVAANPGADPRPLPKVASGGELSRISLAIQVITSKAAAVPTLIFDEVDAGIGGAVAEIVGKKLRELGFNRQILCVTHLPQVASQAGEQWSVAKMFVDCDDHKAVRSEVSVLSSAGRIEEIARMLGGLEITAATRRHAAEMLKGTL